MNKYLKQIIDEEKSDFRKLIKLFKGEKLTPKWNFAEFNFWKFLSENYILVLVMIGLYIGGFFMGSIITTVQMQSDLNNIVDTIVGELNPAGYRTNKFDFTQWKQTGEYTIFNISPIYNNTKTQTD